MTNLIHSPSLPGDGRRPVFNITGEPAVLAMEYFHAELVASVVTDQPERAATYARHAVRLARRMR